MTLLQIEGKFEMRDTLYYIKLLNIISVDTYNKATRNEQTLL